MGMRCFICKCPYTKKCGVSFHSIPKDEKYKKLWLEVCELSKEKPSFRVCSTHFTRDSFESHEDYAKGTLKKSAIPTLYLLKKKKSLDDPIVHQIISEQRETVPIPAAMLPTSDTNQLGDQAGTVPIPVPTSSIPNKNQLDNQDETVPIPVPMSPTSVSNQLGDQTGTVPIPVATALIPDKIQLGDQTETVPITVAVSPTPDTNQLGNQTETVSIPVIVSPTPDTNLFDNPAETSLAPVPPSTTACTCDENVEGSNVTSVSEKFSENKIGKEEESPDSNEPNTPMCHTKRKIWHTSKAGECSDISTPCRAKQCFQTAVLEIEEHRKKLRASREQNRRLRKKLITIQDLLNDLHDQNLISDDAARKLFACVHW